MSVLYNLTFSVILTGRLPRYSSYLHTLSVCKIVHRVHIAGRSKFVGSNLHALLSPIMSMASSRR